MNILAVNPGFVLIAFGLVALFVENLRARQILTIVAPLIALLILTSSSRELDLATLAVFNLDLVIYRIDSLNFIFALAFLIAALINAIYCLHTDDRVQDGMALGYAGAAIAACLCGDLITMFIFWELTALTSVFLILKSGTKAAFQASMRYLAIQILSGVLLLTGAIWRLHETGSIGLEKFNNLSEPGAILIFFAFGIKAAFPLLHNWLQDSYPKASVTGAVILSAFTTKLAVYALARMFPGESSLIWIGAVMTVFPVFFAVIENDLRKVLAYSLNNQVGFMVCAIGVGTELALNGAAGHAFAHIIYKSLLFMSMGAVLYRVGTVKASELGGLYKSMPLTAVFCLIGAASISAFPLFSGFVAKTLTMDAVYGGGLILIYYMLLFASAGVLEHSGIKIPYCAFFGHDSGKRVEEAPFNMLLAMGIASFLCIAIALPSFVPVFNYQTLYALLPYPDYALEVNPFTTDHVIKQMQLLVLATLAFVLLKRFQLYPEERPGIILDADWLYRKPGFEIAKWAGAAWMKANPAMIIVAQRFYQSTYKRIEQACSPIGVFAQGVLTGGMALWTAALLGVVLLMSFVVTSL